MTASKSSWIPGAALGLLLLAPAAPAQAAREGFGMRRALVEISRVQPAEVTLPGTRIQVRGAAQDDGCQAAASLLATQLESEVLAADSRLSTDEVQADAVLEATVLRCETEEQWENRQVTRIKQVGTDKDGKAVYGSVEEMVRYQVVTGQLLVTYKATARRTGASLDAGRFEETFREDYAGGSGAPSRSEVESRLVGQVVDRIVPRLAATPEVIRVLLPKGSLESLIPLAEAGLWNRYLEALERESPRPASEDESYRQYALGLAFEILGYLDENPEVTLNYLLQANQHYDEALRLNPSEKYFTQPFEASWAVKAGKSVGAGFLGALTGQSAESAERADAPPPIQRVQAALTSYRQVISQRDQLASLTAAAAPSGGKALGGGGGGGPAFGNDQVIDMVHAGLGEEIIAQAIRDTAACSFDLSPQGLIQLSKAQVPSMVIQVMQKATCVR